MKIKLRYIHEDVDRHGNVRIYFWRRPDAKIRIRATVGSPEFNTAYQETLDSSARQSTGDDAPRIQGAVYGSFRWLCVQYFAQCQEWKTLGERTQLVRRRIIETMWDEPVEQGSKLLFAAVPMGQLTVKALRVLRDRKADYPEAANSRVKALRQIFHFALEAEHMGTNPARDVSYFQTGSDGFHTWTIEEVNKYRERWPLGTKEYLAMMLMLLTGGRRSDAVRFGRQMENAGWLNFTEIKGRKKLTKKRSIPILQPLRAAIDAMPVTNLTYLVTEFGKPFSANGFGNWFRDRCVLAGVPGRAHGLRKAGATFAAENGATEHQLMAIYGWESPKQAAGYTKKANRKKLAGGAMHLIMPNGG